MGAIAKKAVPSLPDLPSVRDRGLNEALKRVMRWQLWVSDDPLERQAAGLIGGRWQVWLHWVIKKKWRKKHKVPVSPRYAKFYEPYADVLCCLIDLCKECHYHGLGNQYQNSGEWFAAICIEGMRNEMLMLDEMRQLGVADAPHRTTIRQHLKDRIDAFVEGRNPINRAEEPHLWGLVDSAIQLMTPQKDAGEGGDEADYFDINYWNPLVKAYRRYARSLTWTLKEGSGKSKPAVGTWTIVDGQLAAKCNKQVSLFSN